MSRLSAPPDRRRFHSRRLDRSPERWREDPRARGNAELEQSLNWLIPRVQGEIERSPMRRQEGSAAEHVERLKRLLRAEVDRRPRRMRCSDLDHAQLER